jgi:hypothetical protein
MLMAGTSRQQSLVRSWALIALLLCASALAAAPVSFSADARVAVFATRTEEWVPTTFAQVKPGAEFTYDSHLYRVDDSGRAAILPGIDSGKLARADRPYDSSSYRGPQGNDAVQVLDADFRVTGHAVLSSVKPRTRLCFQGRVYYLEVSRNLAYRGIVTATKGYILSKALVRSQPVGIAQSALQHITDRHTAGGASNAGKSVFNAGWQSLIGDAVYYVPVAQSGGNMQRVIDAGRPIGIDRATGKPTNTYTVITTPSGKLVTAFPGLP